MPKAVLAMDLDGTIVDEQGRIHPQDIDLLSHPGEVAYVFASGRIISSIRPMFWRNGLFPHQPIPVPMVLQNGTLLYRPGEEVFESLAFPGPIQHKIFDYFENHPGVTTLFATQEEMDLLWPTPFGERAIRRFDLPHLPASGDTVGRPWNKVMCLSDEPDRMRRIHQFSQALSTASGYPIEAAYSMPIILELTPAGSGKGAGLARLLQALAWDDLPLYAAGDGGNDLSMFSLAHRAFAPATSPADVQAAATDVVDAGPRGLLAPILEIIDQDF